MKRVLIVNSSPRPQGATQAILSSMQVELEAAGHTCKVVRLSDYDIGYCLGCKTCYKAARCIQRDGMDALIEIIARADVLVFASPSYWGDVTGQMKVFIDRCTPWCNTHTPHASLPGGKHGYAIALRTGPNPGECLHIIDSMRHFYGHMGIVCGENFALHFCGITNAADISDAHIGEIRLFARSIT